MEFVTKNPEIAELLSAYGIDEAERGKDQIGLRMAGGEQIVHLHVATPESEAVPVEGASRIATDDDELAGLLNQIVQRLHLSEVLLIPVGRWRNVFDAVAFSLAGNEAWQRVDAAATVELNTRDPLVCQPADLPTLSELVRALLTDADAPEQGLMIVSTASPVLLEVVPDGAIAISVGNQALADEVLETVAG